MHSFTTYTKKICMMHKLLLIAIVAVLFVSCKKENVFSAQKIVDKSIEVSGGKKIDNATIDFNFRNRHYKAKRSNGAYQLERKFSDSINVIKDVLSNEGFKRYANNELVKVQDSMIPRYSASVNSVHYFSVLPYGLNDAAVNKQYLNTVELKGKYYHKIKISFKQEGGGEDFDDVFVYWIDIKSFKVVYIAYSYAEPDGLGLRFREAYNERYVKGVRFVDYNNYKPKEVSATLEKLDDLFENDKLQLLSKIELDNISVN